MQNKKNKNINTKKIGKIAETELEESCFYTKEITQNVTDGQPEVIECCR